jgi:tRNA-Thr(GGU) m(6)t(6)A37 methyltransferase TsaA
LQEGKEVGTELRTEIDFAQTFYRLYRPPRFLLRGGYKSTRDVLKVYPRGDKSKGLRGVFATRSPVRPNPIAISELQVLAINGNRLEVSGLDILDGTPIIDIKKKIDR